VEGGEKGGWEKREGGCKGVGEGGKSRGKGEEGWKRRSNEERVGGEDMVLVQERNMRTKRRQ